MGRSTSRIMSPDMISSKQLALQQQQTSVDIANLQTQVTNNTSSLADITTQINGLPYFDVQKIKDKTYPSDPDYTNAFKQAVSNAGAQTNYLYARILFSRRSSKYTFTNSTPIVLKNNIELVFEEGAEVQYTGSGTSLFTNDPTTASLFLIITGKGRMAVNDKTLFNFRYSRSNPYGFNVKVKNMKFVGPDTTRTGNAFSIGWTDFCHFEDCDFSNLNKAIEIVTYAGETRGNTQIKLDVISMFNVGTGVEFGGLDKATFQNVDIAQCGIGFLGHSKNLVTKFINCHVESYDTYAYKYDGNSNVNNSFDSCSCFLPSASALGGFYATQLDWTGNQNHFSFNNCDFIKSSQANIVGYVPFYCPSPFEWRGVDFDHVAPQKVTNDYPTGGAKIYPVLNKGTFKNLLNVSNLNDTGLLSTYNGTATITSDSTYYHGVKVSWVTTASGQVMQMATREPLNVGWHTLILKGSQSSTSNISLTVSRSNFTTLFNQTIIELSWDYRDSVRPIKTSLKGQTLTIPFYVDTAGYHYISFTSAGATTYEMLLGTIAVVSGFATDYIVQDRVWYKTAVPTTGYWYKDDIVYNNSPASGQPIGWKCITSGSAGTWLSLGNYA